MPTRVSLTELIQAGVRLRPAEAAAIVAEVCAQRRDGRLRGVPSANVIRLTPDGDVLAEGPVNTDGPAVADAAHLLEDLLQGFDAAPEFRAPGGLRIAIARALRTLDLPAFTSLDEFEAAVGRFAPQDVRSVARELYDSWNNAVAAIPPADEEPVPEPAAVQVLPDPTLTISDVRRARRATGLTLDDVSERSRIPAQLLREFEWGYLKNWPAGLYGRSQMVRYARAAGLDEQLVVDIGWPLLEEAVLARGPQTTAVVPAEQSIEALVPVGVQLLDVVPEPADRAILFPAVSVPSCPVSEAQPIRTRHRTSRPWRQALVAVAATITLAIVPAAVEHFRHSTESPEQVADNRPLSATDVSPVSEPAATPATSGVGRQLPTEARPRQKILDGALPQTTGTEPASPMTAQPAAYAPAFSNTGTPVFFREDGAGGSPLVRGDTDSRGSVLKITRVVDDNASNFHARPSPDGSRIAFDSDREGTRAVFVADADGQHVHRISGQGFAAVPSWSPDGQRLAFIKGESDNERVWNLWTADLDSGELHRVTSYRDGQPWGGSWFPDGERIAYSHDDELVVLNLKDGAQRVFKTPRAGHLVRTPAVSPDGRRVIFQVQRDGGWLLDLRNESMRRVLDDPSAEEYTWAPDGHRVAFHSPRAGGWGIWIMGQ